MKFINWIGGRKAFWFAVLLATGVAVALGLGDVPANLMTLMIAGFGFFVGGNVGSKMAESKKASPEAPATPDPVSQDTNVKVNALFEYVRSLSQQK